MRRRVEAKHRFLEAEERERERVEIQLSRNEQSAGENKDIVDNSTYVFDNRGNVLKVGAKINFSKQPIFLQADYGVSKVTEAV